MRHRTAANPARQNHQRQLLPADADALAQEIRSRGAPTECTIRIAAGLPLTSYGRDKPKFRSYLLRSSQPVQFRYEGVEYSITIADVQLFPQGFAALMAEPDLLTDEPSLLLMDIGGWTVDLMRTDNALPVAETAHSLELGMIRCIDEIRETLADLFGTRAEHSGGGYDAYRVKDLDGKEWKIVRDGSIHPEGYLRSSTSGEYKVELNSPKLEYAEMEKLQEVVRALRRAGGKVNLSCGMHVHVDASKHTPQSLKNVLSIMYSKEDILFAALKVNPARIDSYCQAVDEPILEEIRKLPSGASMDQLKDRWYRGRDGSDYHYHQSRYHALNLHSVFYHGTVEWRLFNSTLHAGEVKANIILATTNSILKICRIRLHGKRCKAICLQICRKSRRNVCRRTFP